MSECQEPCMPFNRQTKLMTSLWVALAAFLAFLIIGSPPLYWLTSFMGSTVRLPLNIRVAGRKALPLGVAPSWWGWILHSIVAGALAYGLGLLFMQPWKKDDKCCCPLTEPVQP